MASAEEIVEVRPQHRFDEAALASYLRDQCPEIGGTITVRQFEGGQSNPTFLLEADGRRWVLRKKPPGRLLPKAHMVEREHRVMKALEGSAVPVPHMVHLCEDPSVIGTPFFVMEYVEGRLFEHPGLPGVTSDERRRLFSEMTRVLAALHAVDYRAVGLEDFGRPGNYFARQIGRWTKQYEASKTDPVEPMDRLIEWLPANVPDDDFTTIVHGDFRPHNMIFHPTEPRVITLLDWELSTLGHPFADLAYFCMPYHVDRFGDLAGTARDPTSGVPGEAGVVADYCRHADRDGIPDFRFHLAFSLFRSAAITQGVYKRGLDGNASSSRALEMRDAVISASTAGWHLVESGR